MWCDVKLVEHQEELRPKLVQSILAYVGVVSFLTYRDTNGFVRYAMWFEDRHVNYVLGLHAAGTDLGGVEIRPSTEPSILEECDIIWDMEMAGYGAAPLPLDTGTRSATAALGTQVTDTAYRLLVCHRVDRSDVIEEWKRSGGHPVGAFRKYGGMAGRELVSFLDTGSQEAKPKNTAKPAVVETKQPPYTHTRIILGANTEDHLTILRDSFPAGSLRRRRVLKPEAVPSLASTAPAVSGRNMVHFPVFTEAELAALEIIPAAVTEVPMEYGRAITTTTQPPVLFPDIIDWEDRSTAPEHEVLFMREGARRLPAAAAADDRPGDGVDDGGGDSDRRDDLAAAGEPAFPVSVIGGEPAFPVSVIPD